MSNNTASPSFAASPGFTLPEALVAIAVLALISVALYGIITRGYQVNQRETDQILAQGIARNALENMKPEIRQLDDAETGAYGISAASASSFTFYADTNADNLTEKIRYFVSGTELKRGSITPAGTPLTYSAASEQITTVARSLANSNIFTYYDATFTGAQAPLSAPVDVTAIRLVGVTISVDVKPGIEPDAFTVSDRVQLRNLKDNL